MFKKKNRLLFGPNAAIARIIIFLNFMHINARYKNEKQKYSEPIRIKYDFYRVILNTLINYRCNIICFSFQIPFVCAYHFDFSRFYCSRWFLFFCFEQEDVPKFEINSLKRNESPRPV